MSKIAIIYCPNHRPFVTASKRWDRVEEMLRKYNVDYDMVQSENADSVERLVTMMINNGYEDIVIAGGDSALNDACNCLMKVEKQVRDRICIGVIPNGTMNDFSAFWGLSYDDIELSVQSLVEHRVRKIDVGCIRYTNKQGEQTQRYFLNSINIGLLAKIQKLRQQTRRKFWSRKVSFAVSLLLMVFQKMEHRMTYTINYLTEQHRVTTLCVGNAHGYGQTPNAVPYNGMLDITIVRQQPLLTFVTGIYLFLRGKILMHNRVRPYRSREIEIEAPKNISVSIDGHPMESPQGKFRVTVEQEVINFIIEK